jgi:hypothetical protein
MVRKGDSTLTIDWMMAKALYLLNIEKNHEAEEAEIERK